MEFFNEADPDGAHNQRIHPAIPNFEEDFGQIQENEDDNLFQVNLYNFYIKKNS